MLAIEAGNFASGLAFHGALFQVGTLVMSDFALANAELGFEFSVFPIKLKDNKRSTFDLGFAVKFVGLLTV